MAKRGSGSVKVPKRSNAKAAHRAEVAEKGERVYRCNREWQLNGECHHPPMVTDHGVASLPDSSSLL